MPSKPLKAKVKGSDVNPTIVMGEMNVSKSNNNTPEATMTTKTATRKTRTAKSAKLDIAVSQDETMSAFTTQDYQNDPVEEVVKKLPIYDGNLFGIRARVWDGGFAVFGTKTKGDGKEKITMHYYNEVRALAGAVQSLAAHEQTGVGIYTDGFQSAYDPFAIKKYTDLKPDFAYVKWSELQDERLIALLASQGITPSAEYPMGQWFVLSAKGRKLHIQSRLNPLATSKGKNGEPSPFLIAMRTKYVGTVTEENKKGIVVAENKDIPHYEWERNDKKWAQLNRREAITCLLNVREGLNWIVSKPWFFEPREGQKGFSVAEQKAHITKEFGFCFGNAEAITAHRQEVGSQITLNRKVKGTEWVIAHPEDYPQFKLDASVIGFMTSGEWNLWTKKGMIKVNVSDLLTTESSTVELQICYANGVSPTPAKSPVRSLESLVAFYQNAYVRNMIVKVA